MQINTFGAAVVQFLVSAKALMSQAFGSWRKKAFSDPTAEPSATWQEKTWKDMASRHWLNFKGRLLDF